MLACLVALLSVLLPPVLSLQAAHTGMTYNVSCINSLVVYVGNQAILQLNNKTPVITHSAPMDVFHQVMNRGEPDVKQSR